jgi:predicted secreted Zn-dependent protease
MLPDTIRAETCADTKNLANKLAQEIVRKYNQRDIDYDIETKHGETQGASAQGI